MLFLNVIIFKFLFVFDLLLPKKCWTTYFLRTLDIEVRILFFNDNCCQKSCLPWDFLRHSMRETFFILFSNTSFHLRWKKQFSLPFGRLVHLKEMYCLWYRRRKVAALATLNQNQKNFFTRRSNFVLQQPMSFLGLPFWGLVKHSATFLWGKLTVLISRPKGSYILVLLVKKGYGHCLCLVQLPNFIFIRLSPGKKRKKDPDFLDLF